MNTDCLTETGILLLTIAIRWTVTKSKLDKIAVNVGITWQKANEIKKYMNKKITDLAVLKSYLPLLNLPKSSSRYAKYIPISTFASFMSVISHNRLHHCFKSNNPRVLLQSSLRLHISTYNHTSNECAACQSSTYLKGTYNICAHCPAILKSSKCCSAVHKNLHSRK